MTIDQFGEFAGVDYSAFDDRSSEPLYNLTIESTGSLISDVSDLIIDFVFDPLRLSGVSEGAVEALIASSMDFSTPGTVSINSPLTMFAATYDLSTQVGATLFEEETRGGVVGVPEPAAFVMILFIFGGAPVLRRRQRVNRE